MLLPVIGRTPLKNKDARDEPVDQIRMMGQKQSEILDLLPHAFHVGVRPLQTIGSRRHSLSPVMSAPHMAASPIILSPATAGPPLLPGLMAASICTRSPEVG